MARKVWDIIYKFHHLASILVVVLLTVCLYHIRGIRWNIVKVQVATKKGHIQQTDHSHSQQCDFFSGKWVYDYNLRSPYQEKDCSFIEGAFACERYWRNDTHYRNWRWQPHQCDLPRFNGKVFLEKIRGKRLVFVGDSVNRNQWESLLCLIESSLSPTSNKSTILNYNIYIFRTLEYNATIEFHWSPMLVESNCDDPQHFRGRNRTLRINSIEKNARYWTDADIVIFDSYAWWLDPEFTLLWGPFGSSDAIMTKVHMTQRLYEAALKTWSNWLEINIDRSRTKLFWMSLSPTHSNGRYWGLKTSCYGETEPIGHENVLWESLMNRRIMKVAEKAIDELKMRGVNVQYLNITQMSAYRKEAHPSIYRLKPDTSKKESLILDCLHWCLPGVPDVWNHVLFYYIMKS